MNPIRNPSRSPAKVTRRQVLALTGTMGLTRATNMNSQTPTKAPVNKTRPAAAELCFKDAVELSRMIRAREVAATEVMAAFLSQIKRVNPKVNAICTLVAEEAALRAAKEADERLAKGQVTGPLHGLPHAVKDLVPTAGIRTTLGSRIYKDSVPK